MIKHVRKEGKTTRHSTAKMLDDPSAQEYKRSRELEIAIENANESITTAKKYCNRL